MMNIDSGIPLKNHASCNYITSQFYFLRFTKTLIQLLNLSRANENLEICMSNFIWTIEAIKAVLMYFLWITF